MCMVVFLFFSLTRMRQQGNSAESAPKGVKSEVKMLE